MIRYVIAFVVLAIGAYTDLKERKASNYLWITISCVGLLYILLTEIQIMYLGAAVLIILLSLTLYKYGPVGGADVKAIISLSIMFPYPSFGDPLPPIYFILMIAAIVNLQALPIVKYFNNEMKYSEIMLRYKFPFVASLFVGLLVFIILDLIV